MYRITLINMPFANLSLPSIALTQLKAVVEEALGERVRVRILYLNHDFAHYLGRDLFNMMTNALEANNSGLGDWFFRGVAFPREADNAQVYFQRYFPYLDARLEAVKGQVLAKRAGLPRFMAQLVARDRLNKEQLVGFTSMFAQNVASFAMAQVLKERNPKIVTVLGGANCEAPMGRELAAHVDSVDYVFSGPALVNFPRFVTAQLDGDTAACNDLPGVFSKANCAPQEGEDARRAIGPELPIEVPVPLDYESFLKDLEHNFPSGQVEPSLTFETSRGCWWGQRSHCTFCGLNGSTMAYRAMPSDQALTLFQELVDRYGDRCARFESVDNIMPREYLTEVLPEIEAPPGITFFYEVKADLKDREMEVMAAAGVREIQPGIEALATSTLKLMRKGTTGFQNLAFLKRCDRYGVEPMWNLLIGFPGERQEVYTKYLEDIPRLVHLDPPGGAFPVRFDRYSPYFVRAAEYGLDLEPYDFYGYVYPFPEEVLRNLAYYFEDRNYDATYLSEMVAWKGRLDEAVTRWKARRSGSDGALRARLELFREGETTVLQDSRSGTLTEHPLDELTVGVLRYIDAAGRRVKDIARGLGEDEAAVEAVVRRCEELGVIFVENERYMSLATGAAALEDTLAAGPAVTAGVAEPAPRLPVL